MRFMVKVQMVENKYLNFDIEEESFEAVTNIFDAAAHEGRYLLRAVNKHVFIPFDKIVVVEVEQL